MHLQLSLDPAAAQPCSVEVFAPPLSVDPVDVTVTDRAVIVGRPGVLDGRHEVGYLAAFWADRLPFDPGLVKACRARDRAWEAIAYSRVDDELGSSRVEIVFRAGADPAAGSAAETEAVW